MQKESDEKLMELVKKGDRSAMTILADRYQYKLLNFFYRMSGDRDYAEDLAQESLIRIYKYRKKFQEEKKLFSWIFQIAKNVWNTAYRKEDKKNSINSSFHDNNYLSENSDPSIVYDEQELIHSAIQELPESDRELIVLYHLKGFKYKDLIGIYDYNEGLLRVKLCRALKKLGEILKRMGYEHN